MTHGRETGGRTRRWPCHPWPRSDGDRRHLGVGRGLDNLRPCPLQGGLNHIIPLPPATDALVQRHIVRKIGVDRRDDGRGPCYDRGSGDSSNGNSGGRGDHPDPTDEGESAAAPEAADLVPGAAGSVAGAACSASWTAGSVPGAGGTTMSAAITSGVGACDSGMPSYNVYR